MKKEHKFWLHMLSVCSNCAVNTTLPPIQRRAYHMAFEEYWFQPVPQWLRDQATKQLGQLIDAMADIAFKRSHEGLWGGR